MSEFRDTLSAGRAALGSVWFRIWVGILLVNVVIYIALEATMPGNVFLVEPQLAPIALGLYATWWFLLIRLGWQKQWLILVVGFAFAWALLPGKSNEISAIIMTLGLGSGLSWLFLMAIRAYMKRARKKKD